MTIKTDDPQDIVFVSYARTLFDYLVSIGIGIEPLLQLAKLTQLDLEDSNRTISAEIYGQLWREAEKLSGDEYIGLHVGEVIRPAKYGVLGYVMMSCDTLGESLSRQFRYQDLVGKSGKSQLVNAGDYCELRWHSRLARLSRHVGEEHVSSWVAFARWMTGTPEKGPVEVRFEHTTPSSLTEHRRVFGCTPLFGQSYTGVLFPTSYLQLPLRNKNPEMRQLMDRHAEATLAQHVQNEDQLGQSIRAVITKQLADGPPTIDDVARQLGIPSRTLQHRLSLTERSYKGLLEDVRRRLALQYIEDPHLDLPEIAFLVGFSEQSSFQRAFKRWTGTPPGQYRQNLGGEAAAD